MDAVEIVIRVEDEFKIRISDEDAASIKTPGQLIEYLMGRPEVGKKWSRDYIEISIWTILEDELGIIRMNFNEDSRFIEAMGMD